MKLEIYIRQVLSHKQEYMPLLLLGDEQETLIQGYLDRGELFVLERNNEPAGVCVVTKEGPDLYAKGFRADADRLCLETLSGFKYPSTRHR